MAVCACRRACEESAPLNSQQHIAIVTGAGSGLGAATARMLLEQGCQVAAWDLNLEALSPLRAAYGERVLARALDVSDGPAMEAAMAQVQAQFGVPRILVNCAGVLGAAPLLRRDGTPRPLEAFRSVLAVNLVGTFNAIRCFAALLHDAAPLPGGERGVIINTASVAAFEGLSAQAAYSASKGGVAGMTLPLARELARFGIRVMAIAPGTFATEMFNIIPAHTQARLLADVPFPPRAGAPDEFAHLVRSIIENPMLNGEVIRIDGGVRMREPAVAPA